MDFICNILPVRGQDKKRDERFKPRRTQLLGSHYVLGCSKDKANRRVSGEMFVRMKLDVWAQCVTKLKGTGDCEFFCGKWKEVGRGGRLGMRICGVLILGPMVKSATEGK